MPEPVQAPVQPAKRWPFAGVALRVTVVPWVKLALQVAPQLIPLGLLLTVPLPPLLTVKAWEAGLTAKLWSALAAAL